MKRTALLLGLFLPWLAWAETACPPIPPEAVAVQHQDGRYQVSLHWSVPVDRGLALAVLTDFDHFAEFVPGLRESRVLSRQDNRYQIRQSGSVHWGPFHSDFESTREVVVDAGAHLHSRTLHSTGADARSDLDLTAEAAATRIDYALTLQPRQWLPSVLGVRAIRQEIAGQWTAIVCEMQRRQGGRASGA